MSDIKNCKCCVLVFLDLEVSECFESEPHKPDASSFSIAMKIFNSTIKN